MAVRTLGKSKQPGKNKSANSIFLEQIWEQHAAIEMVLPCLRVLELEWQPLPGCNTIGMLLAHSAVVEGYWAAVGSRRFQSDEEIEDFLRSEIGMGVTDDGMPLPKEGMPPPELKGKTAEDYLEMIRSGKRIVARESDNWGDLQLGQEFLWGTDTLDLAWILHHLSSHLSYHLGQINQIRRYYRFFSEVPAPQSLESLSRDRSWEPPRWNSTGMMPEGSTQ